MHRKPTRGIAIGKLRVRHLMSNVTATDSEYDHENDIGQSIRRQLHLLFMLSLEMQMQEADERLRPEYRKTVKRRKEKFIDWVLRDIYTDMPDSEAAAEVRQELNSDRARAMQLFMDDLIKFGNIAEIHQSVMDDFREAQEEGRIKHVSTEEMNQ